LSTLMLSAPYSVSTVLSMGSIMSSFSSLR
jgi:hypothetical protein